MTNLIGVMKDWVAERGNLGLTRPWLVLKDEPNLMKPSAIIEVEDPDVLGQIILWNTGEGEIDLGSTVDPEVTLISSHQFSSAAELIEALDGAMAFVNEVLKRR